MRGAAFADDLQVFEGVRKRLVRREVERLRAPVVMCRTSSNAWRRGRAPGTKLAVGVAVGVAVGPSQEAAVDTVGE